MAKKSKVRKWLKWTLIVLGALIIIPVVGGMIVSKPLPTGIEGEEAEAFARKMRTAINQTAWDTTEAISWTFAGMHDFIWDRKRDFAQVKWGENVVLINLDNQKGVAYVAGEKVEEETSDELVKTAWAHYCNDSFWLNPISKVFDPGTSRALVDLKDGNKGLLITYSSGGVTPGDSYLWITDPDGLAKEWRMWVGIIPIGGVSTTWEGWKTLATGAIVATQHKGAFGLTLELTDIKAGRTLGELTGGEDIFGELVE